MPSLLWPRKLPVQKAPLTAASWELLRQADRFLDDPDRVRVASVSEMRKIINKVPWAQRGLDWVERVILIYVVKAEQRSRCKVLMKKLEAARLAKGERDLAEAFKARLKLMIDTHLKGEGKFLFNFAYSDKEPIARELKKVVDVVAGLGYDVFINSGTLLGAVRAGAFISHDNDIDLAVILPGNTQTEVLQSFYTLYDRIRRLEGVADQYRSRVKRPVFKLTMKSGVRIDIFPAYVLDGKFYVWPHTHGEYGVDQVLPLGTQMLHGVPFPAPKTPEVMLALNYGPNWQTPDPTFTFPWDAAEARFAPLLSQYRHDRRWDKLKGFFMPWTK